MTHDEVPSRADAEQALRGGEEEPRFKHQTFWVIAMWLAIAAVQ